MVISQYFRSQPSSSLSLARAGAGQRASQFPTVPPPRATRVLFVLHQGTDPLEKAMLLSPWGGGAMSAPSGVLAELRVGIRTPCQPPNTEDRCSLTWGWAWSELSDCSHVWDVQAPAR